MNTYGATPPYGDKNRHRHLGPDTHPRPPRSLPALGHGPGPLQAGLQNLAGLPAPHVAQPHRDRRNG